jgi:hypothetical protein
LTENTYQSPNEAMHSITKSTSSSLKRIPTAFVCVLHACSSNTPVDRGRRSPLPPIQLSVCLTFIHSKWIGCEKSVFEDDDMQAAIYMCNNLVTRQRHSFERTHSKSLNFVKIGSNLSKNTRPHIICLQDGFFNTDQLIKFMS